MMSDTFMDELLAPAPKKAKIVRKKLTGQPTASTSTAETESNMVIFFEIPKPLPF